MTSMEEHKKAVKELEDDMQEKIRMHLLHKKNLISSGFNVNHKWFASLERAKEKFPFDFPHKNKILGLLVREEQFRDRLCYGKSKSPDEAENAIKTFFELKKVIKGETGEDL